jgi:hypothetical protein
MLRWRCVRIESFPAGQSPSKASFIVYLVGQQVVFVQWAEVHRGADSLMQSFGEARRASKYSCLLV